MFNLNNPIHQRHVRNALDGKPIYCLTREDAEDAAQKIQSAFQLETEVVERVDSIMVTIPCVDRLQAAYEQMTPA